MVMSASVAALPEMVRASALVKVAEFTDFTRENDVVINDYGGPPFMEILAYRRSPRSQTDRMPRQRPAALPISPAQALSQFPPYEAPDAAPRPEAPVSEVSPEPPKKKQ